MILKDLFWVTFGIITLLLGAIINSSDKIEILLKTILIGIQPFVWAGYGFYIANLDNGGRRC